MPVNYNQHRIVTGNFAQSSNYSNRNKYKTASVGSYPKFKCFLIFLLLMFVSYVLLLNENLDIKFSCYSQKLQSKKNKNNHMKNGNIQSKTIKSVKSLKIMHFNKGNAKFINKLSVIEEIIEKHSPDIFNIAEANIENDYQQYLNLFPDYYFETNYMLQSIGVSRNVLLIRKQIGYKRRLDLEHPNLCTIWIEISMKDKSKCLFMGGYRQWTLPKSLDNENQIKKNIKQLERYKIIIENWQKACDEKKDVIVLIDDNLDSNINASHNKLYKVQNLQDLLNTHLLNNKITTHNNIFTWHKTNHASSIIDHIYSNCKLKISNVETLSNIFSDHCMLKAIYNTKTSVYKPKFMKIRNNRLITKAKLNTYVVNNDMLKTVFNYTDPDIIANIIQIELNSIIDSIAPAKYIQCKNNYLPYVDNDLQSEINDVQLLLTKAIETKSIDNWRAYRLGRNILQKKILIKKKEYLQEKFSSSRDKWKFVNKFNGNTKQAPPDKLLVDNEIITSPKSLAKLTNEYFINKINNLRKTFTWSPVRPMEILNILIPRCKNTFIIPPITIDQMNHMIRGLKNSSSTGYDSVNNKIIKKINKLISPHLTHLINSIILTNKIPEIFRISKILPLSKPEKRRENIESYRPINNLPCLEKIMEGHILKHMLIFIEENNILDINHHGGRKQHSTTTALVDIIYNIQKNYDNDKVTAILDTDLTAAYDTVDTPILLQKMEHYGIRDGTLELFKNYLSERKQYVCLETYNSQILPSPQCSVIQGSKLSGLLYNIYTNEIPSLYKLLNHEIYTKMTFEPLPHITNVNHHTVNFVDDSSSIITFKNTTNVKLYIESYYKLIHAYYNTNRLRINPDKTALMFVCKPKHEIFLKNFFISCTKLCNNS